MHQVRIDDETYRQLKAHYFGLALRRTKDTLISDFYVAPFEPYSAIKRQMFNILREVNRVRKTAGFELIPSSAIWLKRKIQLPFGKARSKTVWVETLSEIKNAIGLHHM